MRANRPDPDVKIVPNKDKGDVADWRYGRRESDIEGITFRVEFGYKVVALAMMILSNFAFTFVEFLTKVLI